MSIHNLWYELQQAYMHESGKALKVTDGHLLGWGTSVPSDGTSGWETGALFLHTDGGNGDAVYINEGTGSSCNFNLAGGELQEMADVTGTLGYNAGDLLVGDGSGSYAEKSMSGLVTLAGDGTVGLKNSSGPTLGLPFVFYQTFDGTSTPVHVYNANCPRKLRIIDAWVLITSAGSSATTIKLQDGTNDISDAVDIYNGGSVGDTDIVRIGEIDDDYRTLSASDTLDLVLSDTTASPAGEVYVLAIPVA